MKDQRWILPEGIEEVAPPRAHELEVLRRELVDLYATWGYRLIMPPMVEYLESLLVGSARDLDLDTVKFVDQVSGRMMGIRADMTPQAARIDAHHFHTDAPVRLCYLGTVLHARPDAFGGTRSPLQVGCELYGHDGADSDAEIITLMLATLRATGINDYFVDLGHVGIFRGLARHAGLDTVSEAALFDMLQRKARPEMSDYLQGRVTPGNAKMLLALVELNGAASMLEEAAEVLAEAGDEARAALAELQELARMLSRDNPDVNFHYDLAELRGYQYQTGVVYAALVPGVGREVARGGRYNEIGRVFGRARPATGFSADLKTLMVAGSRLNSVENVPIYAPADSDPELRERIAQLRASGESVLRALPGQHGGAAETGCRRQLVRSASGWQVVDL
ncbi:MAG: ATP phosphoribosyltransferase regulatory subunit [Gammaproteobacteria bacterium]|nr:ATP phosphoribosyltransferase regulatory subunit [Gammaproteobacteria bacterium]MCP5137947.1 ATP phosphoribosyltransferase regulatory subunit [Gammaproteobacteria bacterium]